MLDGAHGYLLSQFLSSRVNKRTDQWGGDLEHKSRIVFRIIEEIKKRVPAAATPGGGFLLSMKLNSADFAEGGFTEDESKRVCEMLQDSSLDLVETSGGTYESMAFEHKKVGAWDLLILTCNPPDQFGHFRSPPRSARRISSNSPTRFGLHSRSLCSASPAASAPLAAWPKPSMGAPARVSCPSCSRNLTPHVTLTPRRCSGRPCPSLVR